MSSIWNFLSPLRTGHHYLAKSGNEMFGTVIKHGVNKKTVTVAFTKHSGAGELAALVQQVPAVHEVAF